MKVEDVLRDRAVEFTGQKIECRAPATGELLGYDYSATDEEARAYFLLHFYYLKWLLVIA